MLIITNKWLTKSMTHYFAHNILLKSGWHSDVRLKVAPDGCLASIQPNVNRQADDITLNGTVIPAMTNCHSHAFQRAFAGLTERHSGAHDSFWSWRDMMYRFVAQLTPEDCQIIALQLYIEMLKAGYSRVGEFHYLHHDQNGQAYSDSLLMSRQVIQAAKDSGLRMTLLPVMYEYAGFAKQQADEGQKRFINSLDDYQKMLAALTKEYPSLKIGVTPHSLRAVDIKDIKELHTNYGKQHPFHIHIAEQEGEVAQCLSCTQKRPVEYLYDNLDVSSHWTLIHATHLHNQEAQRVIESGAVIGLCPTTEANLGDGLFNSQASTVNELRWAIGSDSHVSIDPFEELRWYEYGQRLQTKQRAVLADSETGSVGQRLWQTATSAGNQSLQGNADSLTIGQDADFLVLDNEHPSLVSLPAGQSLDAAIFSARNKITIKDVYIGGEKIIDNGVHPLEQQSLADYKQLMSRLLSTI